MLSTLQGCLPTGQARELRQEGGFQEGSLAALWGAGRLSSPARLELDLRRTWGCLSRPAWPPLRHGGFWEGAPLRAGGRAGWMRCWPSPSHHTTVPAWMGRGTCSLWGPPGAKRRVGYSGPWAAGVCTSFGRCWLGWTHPKPGAQGTPGAHDHSSFKSSHQGSALIAPHLSVSLPGPRCTLSPSHLGRTLVGRIPPFSPLCMVGCVQGQLDWETDLPALFLVCQYWSSKAQLPRRSVQVGSVCMLVVLLFGGGVCRSGFSLLTWTEGLERVGLPFTEV